MPAVRSKTLGDRAFMVEAPTLWNSLPRELRAITNVNSFKAHFQNLILVSNFIFSSYLHVYIFFLLFFFLNALSFICFL